MGAVLSSIANALDPKNNQAKFDELMKDLDNEGQVRLKEMRDTLDSITNEMQHGISKYQVTMGSIIDDRAELEAYAKSGANDMIMKSLSSGLNKDWNELAKNIVNTSLDVIFGSSEAHRKQKDGYRAFFNGAGFVILLYKTYQRYEKKSDILSTAITSTSYVYRLAIIDEVGDTSKGVPATPKATLKYLLNEYDLSVDWKKAPENAKNIFLEYKKSLAAPAVDKLMSNSAVGANITRNIITGSEIAALNVEKEFP